MADPARKPEYDIKPDIKPDLHVIAGSGESTPDRANLRAVNNQESNPEAPAVGPALGRESQPSNVVRGPWADKTTPGGKKAAFDKIAFLKKKGPLAGIMVTLVAGGIGISGLLGPGLLIIHLKETLVQALDSASPTLRARTITIFARKVQNIRNSFAESGDGKCNIRCKFGTTSETMIRNLEARGFDVNTEPIKFGGRYVIKDLTFPGESTSIKSGQEFNDAFKDRSLGTAREASFRRVFNSKTAYFLNSKFGSALKTRLGLDKLSKFAGNTKTKVFESFRKAVGLPPSVPLDPAARAAALVEARAGKLGPVFRAVDGVKAAQRKAVDPISYACLAYNASRKVTHAVKIAKVAAFAAVAMVVLNLADQMMAGDNVDPSAVELVGNQLTQTDTNPTNPDGTPNEYYGKSALDSSALGIDLYGDNPGTLSGQDEEYSTGPSGDFVKKLVGLAAFVLVGGATAIVAARGICKIAGLAGLVTACAEEIVAALALAAETAGVGSIGAAAVCIGKLAAITLAISAAFGLAIEVASGWATNSESVDYDETSHGPPVGAMIHNGSASGVFAVESSTYGLHPGSTEAIRQYAIDTAGIKKQEEAVARYEAQDTPFDVYNQYSFLGSMVRSVDITSFINPTVTSVASSVVSILPKAFASIMPNVSAVDDVTAADKKAAIYANCTDPTLTAINVGCDAYGNPSYVMSSVEINMSSDTALDYLISNNQIDEDTGDPIANSSYEKYLDNCANRMDPPGETSADIESDDFEWEVGLKCVEESDQLNSFRVYTMDKAIVDTLDGDDGTNSITDTTTTDTTNTPATNDTTTDTTTDTSGSAFAGSLLTAMFTPANITDSQNQSPDAIPSRLESKVLSSGSNISLKAQLSSIILSKRRELQWTA